MNRFVLVTFVLLLLAGCSQQRFAFRSTIPVAPRPEQANKKPEIPNATGPGSEATVPLGDTSALVQPEQDIQAAAPQERHASASVLKEIVPFTLGQLSPGPRALPPPARESAPEDPTLVISILSTVFAAVTVMTILFAAALLAPALLLVAPLFALIALILGIVSLSIGARGKGFAIAGVIVGSIVLTLTLLVLFAFYLSSVN